MSSQEDNEVAEILKKLDYKAIQKIKGLFNLISQKHKSQTITLEQAQDFLTSESYTLDIEGVEVLLIFFQTANKDQEITQDTFVRFLEQLEDAEQDLYMILQLIQNFDYQQEGSDDQLSEVYQNENKLFIINSQNKQQQLLDQAKCLLKESNFDQKSEFENKINAILSKSNQMNAKLQENFEQQDILLEYYQQQKDEFIQWQQGSEIDTLEEKITALTTQNNDLKKQNKNLQRQKNEIEDKKLEIKNQLNSKQIELDEIFITINGLNNKLKRKDQELKRLEELYSEMESAHDQQLNKEIQIKENLNSISEKMKMKDQEMNYLKEKIQSQQQRISNEEQKNEELKQTNQIYLKDIENNYQHVQELQQQVIDKENEMEAKLEEIQELNEQLFTKNVDSFHENITPGKEENEITEEDKKTIQQLLQKIKTQEKSFNNLEKKFTKGSKSNINFKKSIELLNKQQFIQNTQIKKQQDQILKLRKKIIDINKEKQSLQNYYEQIKISRDKQYEEKIQIQEENKKQQQHHKNKIRNIMQQQVKMFAKQEIKTQEIQQKTKLQSENQMQQIKNLQQELQEMRKQIKQKEELSNQKILKLQEKLLNVSTVKKDKGKNNKKRIMHNSFLLTEKVKNLDHLFKIKPKKSQKLRSKQLFHPINFQTFLEKNYDFLNVKQQQNFKKIFGNEIKEACFSDMIFYVSKKGSEYKTQKYVLIITKQNVNLINPNNMKIARFPIKTIFKLKTFNKLEFILCIQCGGQKEYFIETLRIQDLLEFLKNINKYYYNSREIKQVQEKQFVNSKVHLRILKKSYQSIKNYCQMAKTQGKDLNTFQKNLFLFQANKLQSMFNLKQFNDENFDSTRLSSVVKSKMKQKTKSQSHTLNKLCT